MDWPTVFNTLLTGTVAIVSAVIASRSTKRMETRNTLMMQKISDREKLYAEFVGMATRILASKADDKVLGPSEINPLTELMCRIKMIATPDVSAAAEAMLMKVIAIVTERADSNEAVVPDFMKIARAELDAMRAKLDRMNE